MQTSLWNSFTEQDTAPRTPAARRWRWVVNAALPTVLAVALAVAVVLPPGLPAAARASLFCFGLAVILWSTTRLNAAYVAVCCALLLVLIGGAKQEKFFSALASDVIWLMLGAFVLGAAVQRSGLAARLTAFVVGRARTVGSVTWLISGVLVPLAFLVPSTSGRAAVMLPVFRAITGQVRDARVTRALALLIPGVILVSTVGSLVGAGSHLITNDLLARRDQAPIGFGQWALWGLPFAALATGMTVLVIQRLFLGRDGVKLALQAPESVRRPYSLDERKTLLVGGAMVALWLSEPLHGLEIATVAVLGALVLATPSLGVLKWKDALKAVSWNLLLFVGAALVLGEALIESGAAQRLVDALFSLGGLERGSGVLIVLATLAVLTLTSHLYMTSHAARAAALTPPLLSLAALLELNPVAVVFIGTVGIDYCLTFPVSSKALLLFSEQEEETYQPADLLRLSAVLLPLHVALIMLVYLGYWQFVGLRL